MGSSNVKQRLESALTSILDQRDGPLTEELSRTRAGFGIGQVPARLQPDATTTMVCGFCSTGCGLDVHLKAGEAINLTPATDYPVNLGMACPKGWQAAAPAKSDARGTQPLLRGADGRRMPVTWDRAMHAFASRMAAVREERGGDAMAYLSTGQIATEEMLFLGALAKFGLGMHHGDGNTRQCMATSVAAYKQAFGYDAPPYTYADFEASDVIVLVGSNLCIAHPILWERVCRNPNDPEIIVVDPRVTETACAATQHYAIAPKSDLEFFYAVAQELIAIGAVDRGFVEAHTEGFAAFEAFVADYTPESVAPRVGLPASEIRKLAATIAAGKRVSFWWTMGVNQGHEAVRTAQALIDLALMTGNIGRPGTGANSITGQCNAMGSRLFSNTTSLFGLRSFESAADREAVADILQIDVSRIPQQDSLAYDQIIDAIEEGRIKALWILATNTAHSWIDQNRLLAALRKLDFLVVQDLYPDTETAALADLYLPAAGWGEKDGTLINSERRIGLLKKVLRAPGEALADFQIFRLIAAYCGCADLFERWKTPEDVFSSMKALSKGLPCDISGIEGYQALDDARGIQWPLPEGQELAASERRLFEDGRFYRENGRALFCFEASQAPPEIPDAEYPFVLLTGRGSSSEWHTRTRTDKSPVLRKLHAGRAQLELHPADAESLGVEPGALLQVRSRRGVVKAAALVTTAVQRGQVFLAMHDPETNKLTYPSVDPISRQPSYKYAAVRIEALEAHDATL